MTDQDKQIQYHTFSRFQKNRELYFAPKIFKALDYQVKEAIHYIKAGVKDPTLYISSQPIVKTLKPLYLDAGITYGAKVRSYLNQQKARMPIGFNERMITLMNAYFQTDILNVSEGITETTKLFIQKVLIQATEQGFGIDWIVSQLQNTEVSRIRARMIARTETVTASNQGAYFAAKDTGLLLKKEWLAAIDNRTRHHHIITNGQIVGMEDYFSLENGEIEMKLAGARMQRNGLPTPAREVVNCRCQTLMLTQRNNSGKLLMD